MISILVLTHGDLARELLDAARQIDPELGDGIEALPIPWEVDSDEADRLLRQKIRSLDAEDGLLVLTDMFGGTATNLALPLLEPGKVEVVTGANLPMLIKLGSLRAQDLSVDELATRLTTAGQKSIRVASEFLRGPTRG